MFLLCLVFFFSSRRRHTRYWRDWSSDVCSSDLILLGLIHEGEGVAAKALESLGISLEAVRNQVEEIIGQGGSSPSGHIPFTPRAKKVLELSLREALDRKSVV